MLFLQTSLLSSAVHDCHDSQLQTKSNNTLTCQIHWPHRARSHDTMKNHPNHALSVGLCHMSQMIDLARNSDSESFCFLIFPEGTAKSHACSSQESSNSVNRLGRLRRSMQDIIGLHRPLKSGGSKVPQICDMSVTCRIRILTQVEYALYFELEILWNIRNWMKLPLACDLVYSCNML